MKEGVMTKKRVQFLERVRGEKGSVLISSFLVVVLLLGLGAAVILVSVSEKRTSDRHKSTVQSLHVAEAGIDRAIFDLRQDFLNATGTPSWIDGDINGTPVVFSDTVNFYPIPYTGTALQLDGNLVGTYTVSLQAVDADDILIQSTGTVAGVNQTIQVYVKMMNISPWNNAIFAGAGAAGAMINGNVNIRGSIHILGTGLGPGDYALDNGGTAQLVGNNYDTIPASLEVKVPALDTTVVDGETVETLHGEFRVKNGLVGLSGSATVGESNVMGNGSKEQVDGVYVTDGFGGSQGAGNVYSDNGYSNEYDLGDSVSFPSLSDAYTDSSGTSFATYQQYLKANACVLTSELSAITPNSNFSYCGGDVSMDGSGNLNISGIVYVDGGNNMDLSKSGSDKTITYSGSGTILVTGNTEINVNLVTDSNSGNPSYPLRNGSKNIIGFMTPNHITFNEANIDVMGLFYAEDSVIVQKQTDIMGTIVSNYFDMGTNVPSIYQVPAVTDNLPTGMISGEAIWVTKIVSWQKL